MSMLIFQYLGFPIFFFHLDIERAKLIQDREIILEMFLWNNYSITLIMLGFIVARRHMGPLHTSKQYNPNYSSPFPSFFSERWLLYIIFGVSVAVLMAYLSKLGLNNVAIFSVLGIIETDQSLGVLRSAMGNAFEGKYHWYRLFMRDFLSLASLSFFANWLICGKRISFLFFSISFIITTFSMIMSIEKAPFMYYLISILLVYVIVNRNGTFNARLIIIVASFVFLMIGMMYVYFMNSLNIWVGIKSGFFRITTGQMSGLYHYLRIFPEQVDYLWGRSFPNPRDIFPWEHYHLTVEVNNIVNSTDKESGIVGSMPTFFWGEMYANFGYLGILMPPFLIGYVIYAINILYFRLPMTPLVLAVFIWLGLHLRTLSGTGLSNFVIDIAIFVIMIFTIFTLGINWRGVIPYRRRRIHNTFSN